MTSMTFRGLELETNPNPNPIKSNWKFDHRKQITNNNVGHYYKQLIVQITTHILQIGNYWNWIWIHFQFQISKSRRCHRQSSILLLKSNEKPRKVIDVIDVIDTLGRAWVASWSMTFIRANQLNLLKNQLKPRENQLKQLKQGFSRKGEKEFRGVRSAVT